MADGEGLARPAAEWVSFPFVGTQAAAQEVAARVAAIPPCSSPGRVVHLHRGLLSGGQVARGWSTMLENARRGGTTALTGHTSRRRRAAGRRPPVAAKPSPRSSGVIEGDGGDHNAQGGGQPPAPRAPRDHSRRNAVLVEDFVEEALIACIRRTCGLPSCRPMTKQTSVVTARVIGDKNSRSRAIVLRQGSGKRDLSILWVSSRDGFLCSCFSGHENALFFSASSRSTTCVHTVALRNALSSSSVSTETFCARMRLRADAADFAVCEDYGSAVVWSVLYHSVFSLVTFNSCNVATCIAPCCRRFRGRCGHVRVARDRLGPDGINDIKFGTAPAAVKARVDARRPPPRMYDKVVNNEEEDEGLEKLASDTMRGPLDSAPVDLSARTSRNLLPCAGELMQGEVWNRTADWRTLVQQRPAVDAAANAQQLAAVLGAACSGGVIRDTRDALVEPYCGSCGQKREARHKVHSEPALLTTHHPTAAALKVCCFALLLLLFACMFLCRCVWMGVLICVSPLPTGIRQLTYWC